MKVHMKIRETPKKKEQHVLYCLFASPLPPLYLLLFKSCKERGKIDGEKKQLFHRFPQDF